MHIKFPWYFFLTVKFMRLAVYNVTKYWKLDPTINIEDNENDKHLFGYMRENPFFNIYM